jgi:Protein of unknown function (DUF4242)
MTDVIVERAWPVALAPSDISGMFAEASPCLDTHRVRWQGSLLSSDGRNLVCHFSAPDLESVRIVMRQTGSPAGEVWGATLHDAPGVDRDARARPNVLVTRRFPQPVALEDIQRLENAGAGCLQRLRVRFVRTLFANDRRRMICLYEAADAESVRIAQREAGMPVEQVRAFHGFYP